ncbi:MAG TPA: DUF3488 and transglutaminase-like domain-containing protein [Longimicrobium sp.]|nr:DUF3488 and transglutaminase-like domain-containing protein [Longimicrobium sp.]
MSLATLHRRLVSAMSLAALWAYVSGAGSSPATLAAGGALGLSLLWLPPPSWGAWIERVTRVGVMALFAWTLWVSLVAGRDFMAPVMGILLFLLGTEALRPVDAKNDVRLYTLAFALLIAATAFYPGLGFAAGFASFVALATLAMMAGFLRRQSERFGTPEPRMGRRFLGVTAALSMGIVAASALLFVLFPRLPRQWNVQGRRPGGGEMAGFSNEVSIGQFGGSIAGNPEVMFRVEFPEGPPPTAESIHWRGRSFDNFDGERWSRRRTGFYSDLRAETYAARWGGPFREVRIFGGPPGASVAFGPAPLLMVRPRSAVRVFRDGAGDVLLFGSDNPVYEAISTAAHPFDAQLRQAEGEDGPARRAYLQLPRLDPAVRRLADSLTAGRAARIDQVRAIESWLQRELSYTLDLPRTRQDATLEGFLFRRRAGHCEYFSTAMAVLLRTQGIPARNVNGFLGGEWNQNGRYLAVTGNNAHSWVEVWFPEWGWVTFDPTPPAERADVVEGGTGTWAWPALFWLDGVEYRWYKWVVDYNLERQLAFFRGVANAFGRDGDAGGYGGAGDSERGPLAPWALGAVGVLLLAWIATRKRAEALPPEARAYLGLRRAYARAGFAAGGGDGPLAFAEALARETAPGADAAGRAVEIYVAARFSGHPADEAARRELAAHAAAARGELRRAKRGRNRV